MKHARDEDTHDGWQTPDNILERVRAVFGGDIDFDPCGDPGRPVACNYFVHARGEDGLGEWPEMYAGTAFVNPPYGRALRPWARRIVVAAAEGWEIITLTPARPGTLWMRTLDSAGIRAELTQRVIFLENGTPRLDKFGRPMPAQFPCAMHYFGPQPRHFARVMEAGEFAICMTRVTQQETK